MRSCSNCGTNVPTEATFCPDCGTSLQNSCPNCGTSVVSEASFCPSCGDSLDGGQQPKQVSDESFRLRPQEFSRRVSGSDLKASGLINRLRQKEQIRIEAGNRALFLENGELKAELEPGKHTIDSIGNKLANLRRSQEYVAIVVEDGDTVLSLSYDGIRTETGYTVSIDIELVVGIDDPQLFFTGLMADRDAVTAETFERLLGDALRNKIEATVSDYTREDLYGNRELMRALQQDVEHQCREMLDRNGLRFVAVRSLDFDDDREEIREERKAVEIRRDKEGLKDEETALDQKARERETDDTVHQEHQRVRRETAEQSADHEIDTQEIEHDHEKDDMQRRHQHKAERENVEHGQEKKTTRKEGKVERRELEHEQDVDEMEDLMDLKKKKDMDGLDVEQREQDIEMTREEHEVEMETERLDARDDVDIETLVSMDSVDEAVAELAEIEKAEDLTPEQLEALGAKDSDELAKARQEAHNADAERQRVEDQKQFREEIKDMAEGSIDRMQETTESAMDNMGETGKAASEDTSDNVIVSDSGSPDSGDTTIVQGGSTDSDGGQGTSENGSGRSTDRDAVCPDCESEVSLNDDFCLNCGADL